MSHLTFLSVLDNLSWWTLTYGQQHVRLGSTQEETEVLQKLLRDTYLQLDRIIIFTYRDNEYARHLIEQRYHSIRTLIDFYFRHDTQSLTAHGSIQTDPSNWISSLHISSIHQTLLLHIRPNRLQRKSSNGTTHHSLQNTLNTSKTSASTTIHPTQASSI